MVHVHLALYCTTDVQQHMKQHSLVPRPSPNFPSLAVWLSRNRTPSDGKLGEGLGTRL